jgi:predicted lipoprotein
MRRRVLVAWMLAGVAVVPGPLPAQGNWRDEAVPAYAPPDFVAGLLRHEYMPHAAQFAAAAARLASATDELLTEAQRAAARQAWRAALLAWARLSAVAIGPLIERRSARRIDFVPTRPPHIERAIARARDGAADMDRIGSAGKGFGALEWLLWSPNALAVAPARRYAAQLAQDIAREAAALEAAFAAARERDRSEEETVAAMSEAVNQWIGGIEQLRLQGMERPLHEARRRGRAPSFPRRLSGAGAAERAARWQALRALAVFEGTAAPSPGAGLVPLETYLRGLGLNPLADRLRSGVLEADKALASAASNEAARVQAGARRLAALKTLVEAEVAPALDVRVGFSDADGD